MYSQREVIITNIRYYIITDGTVVPCLTDMIFKVILRIVEGIRRLLLYKVQSSFAFSGHHQLLLVMAFFVGYVMRMISKI